MKPLIILLCAMFVGCTVTPTQNSSIHLLCEKRIKDDGQVKYKCSGKNLVAFRVKFQ